MEELLKQYNELNDDEKIKFKLKIGIFTEHDLEMVKLDILDRRISIAQQLDNVRDKDGNTYFDKDFILNNILKMGE